MHDILAGLNDEQRRAVETINGPLLILAGAGSGKTRVLTHRIAHMLQNGVRPWNILAVTFTNKAAAEMKERVGALVGEGADKILVTTFHSACVRFLRRDIAALGYRTSFTIFDTDDQIRLIKSILKDMGLDPKARPPRSFLSHIDSAKNSMRLPDKAAADKGDHSEQIYIRYQKTLKENNGVDFNDLIGLMVKLLKENPDILERYQDRYRYLMVDEYQDTNQAQYQLVQLLAGKYRNLAVVGDDDQSIYAFRGADISNILNFNKDFPDAAVIRLERNYRSTNTILKAASTVVARNSGRMAKTMWTDSGDGEKIGVIIGSDEEREAELIVQRIQKMRKQGRKPGEFAIIYRSNAASRIFEQQLLQARLPHVLIGAQKFYERREIRDIVGYLKLILNPSDDMACQRVINSPPRGIGGKSLQGIIEEANLRGVPLLEAARGWAMRGRGKARSSAGDFCRMIDSFAREALSIEPGDLVKQVATRSGYIERLNNENTPESQARLDNISELIRAMESAVEEEGIVENESPLERLQRFLDRATLSSPTENIPDASEGRITLLTAHLCKGLEFPVVFVVGMYEGGFPHFRSLEKEEDIEEERRLIYVAFTRAEEKLFVTRPRRRMSFAGGEVTRADADPSRFLSEVPTELMDFGQTGTFARRQQGMFSREARNDRAQRLGFSGGGGSGGRRPSRAASRSMPPRSRAAASAARLKPPPPLPSDYRTITPESPTDLKPGTRVIHPKFGPGVIRSSVGAPNNPKLQIHFDRHGPKNILARYANLEIVLT